jgi:hypothetical protein
MKRVLSQYLAMTALLALAVPAFAAGPRHVLLESAAAQELTHVPGGAPSMPTINRDFGFTRIC